MATTGRCTFASATTSSLSSAVNWSSPTGALLSGGTAANANMPQEEYTEFLNLFDPNLPSIPPSATNINVYIYVARYRELGSGRVVFDGTVQLTLSGGAVGNDKSSMDGWPTSLAEKSYGPAWAFTPTVAELADLGVTIRAYSDSTRNCFVYVDFVEIEVTYDVPSLQAKELIQYS